MSLNLKAMLIGIRCYRAPRGVLLPICGHVLRLDYPGRAPAELAPFDDAVADHAQCRHYAHFHDLCCGLKRYLAPLRPLALAIDGDPAVAAYPANPPPTPALPRSH